MAYVSPTGFVDTDNHWSYEERAYDGVIIGSYAYNNWGVVSWSSFLELTHDSILCSKIAFWVDWDIIYDPQIDIDVYYDGTWNHLYQGTCAKDEWVEKTLAEEKQVTSVRFSLYNPYSFGVMRRIHEVEFYVPTLVVTTEAATQIAYYCAMGNGTVVSGTNVTQRGFEVKVAVDFWGVGPYVWWHLIGFMDVGDIIQYRGQWTGTLTKTEYDHGTPYDPELGAYAVPIGTSGIFPGTVDYAFNDALEACTSYTYRAYAIINGVTYYGEYVAFDTLCYPAGEHHPNDDISEGDPTVPIIPIDIPTDIPTEPYPPFEWEFPPEIPYPPWDFDYPPWDWDFPEIPPWVDPDFPDLPPLPPWYLPDLPEVEIPDYPPQSFIGEFYYHKPYTKKDLDELRHKCIIYNKNSVEFALVLRHNMNVLREFFNMMTDYMGKEEFNDFTDMMPPQRLKELYLDPLEVNDFKDMINGFIRNTVDDNIAVNRNFSLIQEGLADPQVNNEEGYFTDIYSAMKTVTEDNPDVDTLKGVIDNLNQEVAGNFDVIMKNLQVIRARLL